MKTFKQFLIENQFKEFLINLEEIKKYLIKKELILQIFSESKMVSFKYKNEYFDFTFSSEEFKQLIQSLKLAKMKHNSTLTNRAVKIVLNKFYKGSKYKKQIDNYLPSEGNKK